MQFFHLFSFAVVASHAAALPQPAELSEKYSNNADPNLASGLSARSYQPVSNTREDSDTLGDLSFANISSTIDNVGDGNAEISENGEKVVTKIVGPAGGLLAKYLRRSTFVVLDFSRAVVESISGADTKEAESDDLIANILKDTSAVVQDVEAAIKLLIETVVILLKPFDTLKTLMSKSEKVKILYDQISSMMESLTKFTAEQKKLHDKIINELKAAPPK
ncbi:hypothetical protein BASA60_004014 [Batrachochytrium salamandrivorans]|nr:hypothetical protein BASA60_004014 [Batrachochytrium salamandrivorans]